MTIAKKTSKKKPEVTETETQRGDISGLGESVVKLYDKSNSETLCYIGFQEGERKIFFPKAVVPEQVEAVVEFLNKKKFNRHISNSAFDKAQEFADRKFN